MKNRKHIPLLFVHIRKALFRGECVKSLKRQTMKSNIIIVTSTPNHHITQLADKYKIPLFYQ